MKVLLLTIFYLFCLSSFSFEESEIYCTGDILDFNISESKFYKSLPPIHGKLKIPKRFDARDKWPQCKSLFHISEQGKCGGCWAFASSSVMSDRMCIGTGAHYTKLISTQDLLECCTSCTQNICKKGDIIKTFEFWKEHGVVSGDGYCKPLETTVKEGQITEKCRNHCTNSRYKRPYHKDKAFALEIVKMTNLTGKVVKLVQADILRNGPVVVVLEIFSYFANAKSGRNPLTYNKSLVKEGEKPKYHAVKMIGWNVIDGVPVWIIANSWGRSWANKGFGYVRRGKNDFKIEELGVVTGYAKLKSKLVKVNQKTSSGSRMDMIFEFLLQVVVLFILN